MIGHHHRKVPFEFGSYRVGKIDNVPDVNLQNIFSDISVITKGDIFTLQRLKAIWRIHSNHYSDIDFSKYTDPNIFIPFTNSVEQIKIPNWEKSITYKKFNTNLEYESKIPMNTSVIWIDLDWAYTYDFFVNDHKIHSFRMRRHCPNGSKIYFSEEQLIKKISLKATNVTNLANHGFNLLEFLRLHENTNKELEFGQECVVII